MSPLKGYSFIRKPQKYDYLLGEGANAAYNKDMIKRLEEVENLPPQEKDRIFHFIGHLIIRDFKASKAYAS